MSRNAPPSSAPPLTTSLSPSCIGTDDQALGPDSAVGVSEAERMGPPTCAGSFLTWPWPPLGPLLFDNETSDARDHCANERTFLSHLRLAIFMAVLSIAISLSFHLNHQPTDLERRMAKPLGAIFWALSVLMLALGLANYIQTVNKYGRRLAIVQTGWRTQLSLGIVAFCIFATCVVLLVVTKLRGQQREQKLL
ncbi:hypothetical protein E4U55_003545 [Claviceps digitariae]|nr:hypothetical protein E4U55_003545 [Claviceps digitariae]